MHIIINILEEMVNPPENGGGGLNSDFSGLAETGITRETILLIILSAIAMVAGSVVFFKMKRKAYDYLRQNRLMSAGIIIPVLALVISGSIAGFGGVTPANAALPTPVGATATGEDVVIDVVKGQGASQAANINIEGLADNTASYKLLAQLEQDLEGGISLKINDIALGSESGDVFAEGERAESTQAVTFSVETTSDITPGTYEYDLSINTNEISPSISLSWGTQPSGGVTNMIDVAQGDTVDWKWSDEPDAISTGWLSARADATMANAPEGYTYLRWSFGPPENPSGSNADEMMDLSPLGTGANGTPNPSAAGSIGVINYGTSTGTDTLYVWNCDSDGNLPPNAWQSVSSSFYIATTPKPSIEFNPGSGGTLSWVTGSPTIGITATLLGDYPAGYDYLKWSLGGDFDNPTISVTSGGNALLFLPPYDGTPVENNSSVNLRRNGSMTGIIYVWNCNSAGEKGTVEGTLTVTS